MLMFKKKEGGMFSSNTRRRVGLMVLLAFMLSSGFLGAGFHLFDLATCTARGGKVVGRNNPGDT